MWLPFTSRMGRQTTALAVNCDKHWAARHAVHDSHRDARVRCQCSGTFLQLPHTQQCCEAMTAEDLRCDLCREHCYAVTNAGELVPTPLIVTPGQATLAGWTHLVTTKPKEQAK